MKTCSDLNNMEKRKIFTKRFYYKYLDNRSSFRFGIVEDDKCLDELSSVVFKRRSISFRIG